MTRVIIIGAGFGGLAAAAELARAGVEVTVLEAHVYPGGCAGSFYHQGYRFDAGATLAGGFAPGAPLDLIAARFNLDWQARPAQAAMTVHLPGGEAIVRWADPHRWQAERLAAFGPQGEPFWRWQETTAQALWDFALRLPPWPPQSLADLADLARVALPDPGLLYRLIGDAFRTASDHLRGASARLRLFVDAQLLISAQAASASANALYSAAALDLPRRGVAAVPGGMGGLAEKMVAAVRRLGGKVLYRQEVTRVKVENGRPFIIETKRGASFQAESVIFNLTPWDIAPLLGESAPPRLRRLPLHSPQDWGAFTLYLGLDQSLLPHGFPLHHQLLSGPVLGEGRSVFLSISPDWDAGRAPAGKRALTLSTHTRLAPWWDLLAPGPQYYQQRRAAYTGRLLALAERLLPGLREAAGLILPGTPVTFARYTRRARGWVGGFPQTSLFPAWGPRLAPGLWLVGDSLFPGQSVPAVMLGGLRVARAVLRQTGRLPAPFPDRAASPIELADIFQASDKKITYQ